MFYYQVKRKSDNAVVYKYSGIQKQEFGGEWNDSKLYSHAKVTKPEALPKSFGMRELLDHLIAKGVITKSGLPANGKSVAS